MRHALLFGTTLLLAVGQVLFKFEANQGGSWFSFLANPVFILAKVTAQCCATGRRS